MMKMFGKMKDIQAKLTEAQENLAKITASAEVGAGMVKATVNGKKQLMALDLDPTLLNPESEQILRDLIISAVNKALEEVDELSKEAIRKSTEGMLPNIPGFNFGA